MLAAENDPKCEQSGVEETLAQICIDEHPFEIEMKCKPLDRHLKSWNLNDLKHENRNKKILKLSYNSW